MTHPMAYLVKDLSAQLDGRTKALHKAVDALEAIRDILYKSRRGWKDKDRLMYTICEKTLEQVEMHIDTNQEN